LLNEDLLIYGKSINSPIKVVYDGASPVGAENSDESLPGVLVVFSPMMKEADAVIERMAAVNKDESLWDMTVCSGDRMIRDSVGMSGAVTLSPNLLIAELKAVRTVSKVAGEAATAKTSGTGFTSFKSGYFRGPVIKEKKKRG